MTHFKSRTYENMVFVHSKPYLLCVLCLYVISIYLSDYAADHIVYYIKIASQDLKTFSNHQGGLIDGFFKVIKSVLIGKILPSLMMITVLPSALYNWKHFCSYKGFKYFDDEYLIYSLLRVIADMIMSSISIIIIFGIISSLSFFDNQHVRWLKNFNFSILLICLIRSGIIVTLIQGLIYHDKRERLTPARKIIPFLIPLILAAVMLIPQHITYVKQKSSVVNPSVAPANILNKKEKFEPINGGYPSFFNDEKSSKTLSHKHDPKTLSHKYQPIKK